MRSTILSFLDEVQERFSEPHHKISTQYPRSPKVQMEGITHLGLVIDKIRLRHAGQIQDYNFMTVGFDPYLLNFLELDDSTF